MHREKKKIGTKRRKKNYLKWGWNITLGIIIKPPPHHSKAELLIIMQTRLHSQYYKWGLLLLLFRVQVYLLYTRLLYLDMKSLSVWWPGLDWPYGMIGVVRILPCDSLLKIPIVSPTAFYKHGLIDCVGKYDMWLNFSPKKGATRKPLFQETKLYFSQFRAIITTLPCMCLMSYEWRFCHWYVQYVCWSVGKLFSFEYSIEPLSWMNRQICINKQILPIPGFEHPKPRAIQIWTHFWEYTREHFF